MVTGDVVLFAALLVQPDPAAAALHEIIADLHAKDRADAREAVCHDADQGSVAQADEIGHVRLSAVFCGRFGDGYAVKQRAGLVGRQYRCLAFFNDIFGAAHGMGRIDVDDMPGNQPVEQHTERGQVLLDCRRRKLVLKIFDEGGHVERLDLGKFVNAVTGTPVSEAACSIHVRAASVIVADLCCEKFQNALCRFRRGCKNAGWRSGEGVNWEIICVIIGALFCVGQEDRPAHRGRYESTSSGLKATVSR
jgi:hypothetical protein